MQNCFAVQLFFVPLHSRLLYLDDKLIKSVFDEHRKGMLFTCFLEEVRTQEEQHNYQ